VADGGPEVPLRSDERPQIGLGASTHEAFAAAANSAEEIVLAGFSFLDEPLNRRGHGVSAYQACVAGTGFKPV
jgi:hypothetical protein